MFWFGLIGCFAPEAGEWGFFDIAESGDCAVESAGSLEGLLTIEPSPSAFVLHREEDSFSCQLNGKAFLCDPISRAVESEEVSLEGLLDAEGEFDSKTSGVLSITSSWSCVSGACDTYGLGSCTRKEEGTIRLSAE